jgi:hypothetical protein
LTQHSGSFEIFGIAYKDNTLSWKDFKREIQLRDQLGGSSILLSIEQVLLSAISPTSTLDNDQIMKSMVNDSIYRILVTRQVDFYNGRKIVDMYFVQRLLDGRFGNADTTVILGFINVAAKYRFIFIERDSPLSVESFSIVPTDSDLKNKVRRLTRELLLIEEEARSIGLDQPAAIYKYFGSDQQCLGVVNKLQLKWYEHRQKLMTSAERVLRTDPDTADFKAAREEWLKTLSLFRDGSEEINSIVTTQALENLKKSFVAKPQARA